MNDGVDVVNIPNDCVMISGKVAQDALVMMWFVISALRVWDTRTKTKCEYLLIPAQWNVGLECI